jgi:hypothetical protein
MNSLSWMLYLSDVIPNIGVVLGIASFLAVMGTGICLMAGSIEDKPHLIEKWKFFLKGAAILAALSVLVPSKATMLSITASQFGEHVAKSPDGQEILNDLKEAIKAQIKTLKGSGK